MLVDVRTKTDFETSPLRLPGAVRLDPDAVGGRPGFELTAEPLADGRHLLTPARARPPRERVAKKLRERGFKTVRILKGGLGGWTNARLPVESKSHLPSIGLEIYKNLTLGDLERRAFKAGEVIFKEGADAKGEAYVVHSGIVEALRRTFDGERPTARHASARASCSATWRCSARRRARPTSSPQTDVELLVIKNERLDWLIRNRPQLTIELVRRLSNWVVQTDRERAPGEPMTEPAALLRAVLDADLPLPAYARDDDAGLDLYAARGRHARARRPRPGAAPGLALAIPPGYAGFVLPRSGLALRHGVTPAQHAGPRSTPATAARSRCCS